MGGGGGGGGRPEGGDYCLTNKGLAPIMCLIDEN